MIEKPQRLPCRECNGQWEVLIAGKEHWTQCHDEHDARVISSAPILEYESLEGIRSGEDFAKELEEIANVFDRYLMGFGSRFFQRRADEIRGSV